MIEHQLLGMLWATLAFFVHLAFVVRAVLRPHREPASRMAWVVVILVFPIGGIVAYILLGETNIGRRRSARSREVLACLPDPTTIARAAPATVETEIPDRYVPLFRLGLSVNGFPPTLGNRGKLLADSNATIDALVADIDAAKEHVHLAFYIWLPDTNGLKVVEALKRAAGRGVVCRAMADALGSRSLIGLGHWADMQAAGVQLATALPIGNALLRPLRGRIDCGTTGRSW